MSDLDDLQSTILTDIAAAADEAALETVRVAALGKKGSISALLSTLGKMSPDERKTEGAKINLAKDAVTQALTARREVLKSAALDARLELEREREDEPAATGGTTESADTTCQTATPMRRNFILRRLLVPH